MANIVIPNFVFPEVGGDRDTWGLILNENLSKQVILYNSILTNISSIEDSILNLSQTKLNVSEVDTIVTTKMDEYWTGTIKPNIDDYIENISKVEIDSYVEGKKTELQTYVTDILKVDLTNHSNTLKSEITSTGEQAQNSLNEVITEANTLKTDLNTSISTGQTLNTNLNTSITEAGTAQTNLQSKIDEGSTLIQSITNEGTTQVQRVISEGDTQVARLSNGGFIEVTDITTDLPLQVGYYEIVDDDNNQFSIQVNSDLLISENSVIRDVSGFVRLQGVKMPCMVAIRSYPTLTDNTEGVILIEMESDFENVNNLGSTEGIKTLNKQLNMLSSNNMITKLDKGDYTGNAQDLFNRATQIASDIELGVVKVGANLNINSEGVLNADVPDLTPYQPKEDSSLNTTSKYITPAINEIKTSTDNLNLNKQSKEDNDLSSENKNVIVAINSNTAQSSDNREKIIALLGKEPRGNISQALSWVIDDYVWDDVTERYYRCTVDNQDDSIDLLKWEVASLDELRNKVDAPNVNTILYDGSLTSSGLITLSDSIKNYEKIGFELTGSPTQFYNIGWKYLYPEFIRYNNTGTGDNEVGDYAFQDYFGSLNNVYFRDDGLNIYTSDRGKIMRVVGFNKLESN